MRMMSFAYAMMPAGEPHPPHASIRWPSDLAASLSEWRAVYGRASGAPSSVGGRGGSGAQSVVDGSLVRKVIGNGALRCRCREKRMPGTNGLMSGSGLLFAVLSQSGLPFLRSNQPCRHLLGFLRSEPDGGADQGRVPRRRAAGARRSRKAARGPRRASALLFPQTCLSRLAGPGP